MTDDNKAGVYQISISGKRYVGSTVGTFKERWRTHLSSLKCGNHHNAALQKAYNESKTEEVIFSILEIIEDKEQAILSEQKYINKLIPEYNSKRKASNSLNSYKKHKLKEGKPIAFKCTEEFRQHTEALADAAGESLSDYVRRAVETRNSQHQQNKFSDEKAKQQSRQIEQKEKPEFKTYFKGSK